MNYKKSICIISILSILIVSLCGCVSINRTTSKAYTLDDIDTSDMFTENDYNNETNSENIITFNDNSIQSTSSNASIKDNQITIKSEGTYILTGSSSDASIIIDADDNSNVKLVLNNINITSKSTAAIYAKNANKVIITSKEATTNNITSNAKDYTLDDNNIDGAIFANCNLTFNGKGTITINSENNNGIVSKDNLKATSGTLYITSKNNSLEGKNSIRIDNTSISLISKDKDALHVKSSDDSKGFIYIKSGNINIDAKDDGLDAKNYILIENGDINITNSYEGIEAQNIFILDGNINVTSCDDGFNATTYKESESTLFQSQDEIQKNEDPMACDENASILIKGGSVSINASGDGLDSNGTIEITGGKTFISASPQNNESAIDYGISATIKGGELLALGSCGMVENISNESSQVVITTEININSEISVLDSLGNTLMKYSSPKKATCAIISSPIFQIGQTYTFKSDETTKEITVENTITSNVARTQPPVMPQDMNAKNKKFSTFI